MTEHILLCWQYIKSLIVVNVFENDYNDFDAEVEY